MAAILDTGWFPLSSHKGKKLVVFGLAVLSIAWFHGFQDNSMDSFFLPLSLLIDNQNRSFSVGWP